MRSKWKGIFSDQSVDLCFCDAIDSTREIVKIMKRGTTILNLFVGARVMVHMGRGFIKFTVKSFMVGHKFGEYAMSKSMGRIIHTRKKKK